MSLWMRSASTTCWPTVYTGVSAESGSWKIIDICLPRMSDICRSSRPISSRPPSRTDPLTAALDGSRPMIASEVTDLPDPDSPTMPSTSPRRSE